MILFLIFSLASADLIRGEGYFYVQKDDSFNFVKKQLLSSAFRNVIHKELAAMKLNSELFWKKYNIKFEESFEKHHKELKTKYDITDDTTPSEKQLKEYRKTLRIRRLLHKRKFGNLSRAIRSYSVKKSSKSSKIAGMRHLIIQAKVDRKALNQIYFKFIRKDKKQSIENLYLSLNLHLKKDIWLDMGLENGEALKKSLMNHWKNWFESNMGKQVDNIILADGDMVGHLKNYLQISASEVDFINRDDQSIRQSKHDDLNSSFWIDTNVVAKKKTKGDLLENRTIFFEGDFVLIQMKSGRTIFHHDFKAESFHYNIRSITNLDSNLTSFIYRLPLNHFAEISNQLSLIPDEPSQVALKLRNIRTVQDLIDFNDMLVKKGMAWHFSPKIHFYKNKNAVINLLFQGDKHNLMKVLYSMENTRINNASRIVFESKDNPFSIFIKRSGKVLDRRLR